ncbi:group II intron reverse transcriptase/maturase [Micromonospora sp. LOL_024]|uniref:group II intron reverse transcriptase/maturase n=1 Tax=Micromonospora sp. LOL_024 TaxID=3345412 RepID=UPI003A8C4578
MTTSPEPKDKLGTASVGVVNGPEDEILDWDAVDWRACEETVRRLRQRIFTASQVGDLKRVRNLQKLMLRSRANTLLAVRRVTEVNAGRLTAGVDGRIILNGQDKADLAAQIQRRQRPWQACPVKRVYIPKADGRRRPLGIPVIVDRVLQARVATALEPEWEARFEPRSYGFRPGRSCQDAIQATFSTVKGKNPARRWVLDADLKAAFDRIDHHHLLIQLGWFPAREQIRAWLTAGVVEQGLLTPTEEGTPQGGVVSPLLLNIALHGMEHAAGVRYRTAGTDGVATAPDAPVLIRYADDFVALCRTRDGAMQVKARLAAWLTPRGLAFNEDKTRVVDLDEGYDFLGFNVRRYHGLLLIKPSKTAVRRIRKRLRTEVRALRGSNAAAVIARLNPIIRGWAAYYRSVVASEIFTGLDHYLWKLVYKWARHTHPNKPTSWVVARYFGMFNKSRQNKWVFGDRDSGAYLHKFAWIRIVRHQMVTGTASPDDAALTDYWHNRRQRPRLQPPVDRTTQQLLDSQRARCVDCGQLLLHADRPPRTPREWEQWYRGLRKAVDHNAISRRQDGSTHGPQLCLLHTHCHRRTTGKRQASDLHASDP